MTPLVNEFELEDTRYWKLKGQGNANAVFAYAPDSVRLPKKYHEVFRHEPSVTEDSYAQRVIRVRKEKLPENSRLETSQCLEKNIWDGTITDWGPGMPHRAVAASTSHLLSVGSLWSSHQCCFPHRRGCSRTV